MSKYYINPYLARFLKMKCAGDILNIVNPVDRIEKEITESYSIIELLKEIAIENPMKYNLYDLCAGNSLTSIMSIFMLPIKNAIAIDKRERKRHFENAKRFNYIYDDICNVDYSKVNESILIGVHACKKLSIKIIEIFNEYNFKYLFLMPCCVGKMTLNKTQNKKWEKLSQYDRWTNYLLSLIKCENKKYITDKNILSPANNIIIASKTKPQLLKKFSFKIKKNKLLKGNDKRKVKELEK